MKKRFVMHSIRLKISDKIYDNVLWWLSRFSKDEVEIIIEDSDEQAFEENKKYLSEELNEILEGSAKFLTEDEAEYRLEKMIKKNENRLF
ncbi:MAG: tRNA pseudouridine synthase A [Bacteroidota bacterium]